MEIYSVEPLIFRRTAQSTTTVDRIDTDSSEVLHVRNTNCSSPQALGACQRVRAERRSKSKGPSRDVRSADLDTSALVDQISAELLEHLIVCRTCSVIFAAQERSIGEAGCVEGKRIASESTVRRNGRKVNRALRHLTEQTLDDFIFDRLACDERQPLEHHLSCCSQCAKTAEERETLATWIRAAFYERKHGVKPPSNPAVVLQAQRSASALSVCA